VRIRAKLLLMTKITAILALALIIAWQSTINAPLASALDGDLQNQANELFWQHHYRKAHKVVLEILKDGKLSCADRARCLTNLSICEAQMDEEDCQKHALAALKLADPKSLTYADATAINARCLLMNGDTEKAQKAYEAAIRVATALQGEWGTDIAPFYEGLAACCMRQKDFAKAESHYFKVAKLDLIKYGPDETHLAWSLMSLNAAARALKHDQLATTIFKKMFWNFRHQNELRILSEYKEVSDSEAFKASLRAQLYGTEGAFGNRELALDLIKDGIPESALANPIVRPKTFDHWFKERIGRDRAPGMAFFDPTKKLKGIIVTVHGLGLYGGAFTPFATRIQHDGIGVISFDVRGFGSYRNDELLQQLDLRSTVADIKRILTELRSDYPHTPLLILGESMGGAVALRIAAEAPHLVDAVISSVPSGSRYQSKKTALKVGLKFLNNKHTQFDVTKDVVEKATCKADLRDMWEGDEHTRMKLSPSELVNFQNFMGDNVRAAQKIDKTPVIIYQGYSDNLVKPMGTLAIYQAIPQKDKDLIFIGRAEHLIFEEGQFDDVIYNGTLGWILRHLPDKNTISAQVEPCDEPKKTQSHEK